MKVKYADQTATGVITEGYDVDAVTNYATLENIFPSLEAGDAILIKKVVLNLANTSVDVGIMPG